MDHKKMAEDPRLTTGERLAMFGQSGPWSSRS